MKKKLGQNEGKWGIRQAVFLLFKQLSSMFFQRFHYRGDILHLEEGLRQLTSIYSLRKGINLRRIVWPQRLPLAPNVIHGSATGGQRNSNKFLAMIK
jgi:hypothetical protein